MFDILLWISIALSFVVLVQSVWFLVLSLKYLKKQEEKNEKNKKDKKNKKQVLASAGLLLFGIFPIPLTVFCLLLLVEVGLLAYALVYMTKKLKEIDEEKEEEPVFVPPPAPEPEPEPEPAGPTEEEIVMVSELVRETITIEEAHEAITDEVAAHFIEFEKSDSKDKKYSKKSIINIDTLSDNFASGQTVNLDSLKAKGLIPGGTDFVKVLARGHLDKKLTVEAQDFSADAVKMIILTGGKVIEKI